MLSQKGPPPPTRSRARARASYPKLALMASATVALSTRARTRTVEVSSTLLGFGRSNGQQVAEKSHTYQCPKWAPFFRKTLETATRNLFRCSAKAAQASPVAELAACPAFPALDLLLSHFATSGPPTTRAAERKSEAPEFQIRFRGEVEPAFHHPRPHRTPMRRRRHCTCRKDAPWHRSLSPPVQA